MEWLSRILGVTFSADTEEEEEQIFIGSRGRSWGSSLLMTLSILSVKNKLRGSYVSLEEARTLTHTRTCTCTQASPGWALDVHRSLYVTAGVHEVVGRDIQVGEVRMRQRGYTAELSPQTWMLGLALSWCRDCVAHLCMPFYPAHKWGAVLGPFRTQGERVGHETCFFLCERMNWSLSC